MWTLYTSENCSQCEQLKKYLADNHIEFDKKVLDVDFNTGDLIAETSKRGNPTLSFPVLIKDNVCYTTRQFLKGNVLDEVWLGDNL